MVRIRPVAVAAGVALVLAACAPGPPAPDPTTPAATTPAATTPAATPATPGPATPRPAYAMPVALVVHATRPVSDVPVAAARALLADGSDRWSEIGQEGGRMRVVTTDQRSPAQVLAAVRDSRDVLGVLPADAVDPTVRVLTVGGLHPLRQPGDYPLTTRSDRPVPEVTTLTGVGDIMLGRRVGARYRDRPGAPLDPLATRLAGAEITVGNLESTLSTAGSPTQGSDSFAASPRVLPGLRRSGFDVLSVANNHVGDYGDRALRQTLDRLADSPIRPVGAGRNLTEARRPVVIERDGIRIGFLAVDSIGETPAAGPTRAGTNRLNMPPRTGPLDRAALRRITRDIAALDRRVDAVVVMTHWGTQYTHRPEPSQRAAARAFAQAGADLVLGGHPHWVQGLERFGETVVVQSLGNYVFDMDFQVKTREGIFAEVVFWGGQVKAVEPVPYVIGDDFAPRLAGRERGQDILNDVWGSSRGPYAIR